MHDFVQMQAVPLEQLLSSGHRVVAEVLVVDRVEFAVVDEIANVLEINASTVRVHLSRGRQSLADALGLDRGDSQ